MKEIIEKLKVLLSDISIPDENTPHADGDRAEISASDNPLNPYLLSYCLEQILGFNIKYRPFEKINYIVDFDYKGTRATATHRKLSYTVHVDPRYRDELLSVFHGTRELLEKLFMLIGEDALVCNRFSMRNDTPRYFTKLDFYRKRIAALNTLSERPAQDADGDPMDAIRYRSSLRQEMLYHIETYIDVFFSASEHVLTLLFPFVHSFEPNESYFTKYIRNTRWSWADKLRDVLGGEPDGYLLDDLNRIKEIYRNHNAHGSFSREMMAYVGIPGFGRYPMLMGKRYLQGFTEDEQPYVVSYELFEDIEDAFSAFWRMLGERFEIPMRFITSGIAIPVDTSEYLRNAPDAEAAERYIDRLFFMLDNQSNMDW